MDPNTVIVVTIGLLSLCALLGLIVFGRDTEKVAQRMVFPGASGNARPTGLGQTQRPPAGASTSKADSDRHETFRKRLIQAGLYKRNSKAWFYFTQCVLASIPFAIGFVAYSSGVITLKMAMLISIGTAIAGVVAPGLWLDFQKSRRQTNLRRALPDALDVIIVCVEAGLSLNAALVRVARELSGAHPLLARELTIVHREIQMGTTTGAALKNMAQRFDLEELRSLATVIRQSERFGTSVAQALQVHCESLRDKRMQVAAIRAQKAAVKLLFPTVICIFPALMVVVLGPAVFDILDSLRAATN